MTEAKPISSEALFLAHARFVATFALRLGVPRGDIDDVVQETFLVAHRHGGFVPGAAQPTTWLAAIVIRIWSTLRRSRRRKPEHALEDSDHRVEGTQDVFQIASARQSLRQVTDLLENLDEEQRGIFVLFEFHGESCDAIAAALGIPIGTVYSRLHSVRKKLLKLSEPNERLSLNRLSGARP